VVADAPGRVRAVAKAAEILGCFTPRTHVLSTRSLARITGIPRSTVHGLCLTLVDAGLLQEVPGRGYSLGLGLVALGGQVLHRHNIVEAAEGMLTPLLDEPDTWALVGQLVDGWVVYLARYMSARHGPVNSRTGLRVPAHRTACGKAALSRLEPAEVVRRVTGACESERIAAPDFAVLAAELEIARHDGHVFSADWRPGRSAIGAPLIDRDGTVIGGISIGGPSAVFGEEQRRRLSGRIGGVAARISARLPPQQEPRAVALESD